MERISWRNFDFYLLGIVAALTIFGITMINSAIAGNVELLEENTVQRQITFSVVGIIVMFLIAAIDYRLYQSANTLIYAFIFVLLGLLFILGEAVFGSARWFDLGIFQLQPSEIAKLGMILVLANFFSRNQPRVNHPITLLAGFGLTMGITFWILLQPNLSTSLLIFGILGIMIFASGLKIRYIVFAALIGLALLALLVPMVLNPDAINDDSIIKPYQIDRITNFLFPDEEASYGEQYNVQQALITIGSGGWLGKGYGQGTQSQLRFIKVRHTDFIFSVTAEEFGFIGASLLIVVEFLVIFRCLRAARLARDTYGALIAYGVAAQLSFQAIVNIGMNLQLLPVTGLPLPFVSYGGSALLTMFAAIGLVQSVIIRHKSLEL